MKTQYAQHSELFTKKECTVTDVRDQKKKKKISNHPRVDIDYTR